MLADFAAELAGVAWRQPEIPVVSNVTGRLAEPGELADPRYWAEHVRRPVRFADGIAAAVAHGGALFVELGPGAALTALVEETATARGAEVTCVAALRDGRPEEQTLLASVAELFVRGVAVDWGVLLPATAGRVDLPTYAFDHQHYWLPRHRRGDRRDVARAGGGRPPAAGCGGAAAAAPTGWCSPRACRCGRTPGSPTTPSAGSCSSRAPGWWSWPCGPVTRPGARCSRSS